MLDIEYKNVMATGVRDTSIQDGPGVVTAIVSVTGIRDNVGDIIEPGAYRESLAEIKPKGAWGHDWQVPVSKALECIELMPGDSRLPATLPNGAPWPKQAGALRVKMQFNLDTNRGREAHSDVLFFGDDQEWSIGYKVPEGGARHEKSADGPTRYISRLKCYEYSPVLFGAMPSARTASVKDAQLSFKTLMGEDITAFLADFEEWRTDGGTEQKVRRVRTPFGVRKYGQPIGTIIEDDSAGDHADAGGALGVMGRVREEARRNNADRAKRREPRPADDDPDDPIIRTEEQARYYGTRIGGRKNLEGKNSSSGSSAYRYEDDDEYEDDMTDEEKSALMNLGITPGDLRQAIDTMTKVLSVIGGDQKDAGVDTIEDAADAAMVELEALNYDTTVDAVAAVLGLDPDQRATLERLAAQFDAAESDIDREALFDALGEELEGAEEGTYDGLRVVARVAGDTMEALDGEKSSRYFGPETKGLLALKGRQARHRAYLVQLKVSHPEVLEALTDLYPMGSGMESLISEVKRDLQTDPASGVTIDLKELAELKALATS